MGFQSDVLTLERDGHVATLWLDNPDARNAMGDAFWRDLPRAMADIGGDVDVRAVVIAAKGRHFTAGLDLSMFAGGGGGTGGVAARQDFLAMIRRLQASITS